MPADNTNCICITACARYHCRYAVPGYSDQCDLNNNETTDKMQLQNEINDWCEKTFGPVGSNLSVAVRANQEMSELLAELNLNDKSPNAVMEAADVVICLYRLVGRMGFDLDAAIKKKMEVNKKRKWQLDGNGHGKHIKSVVIQINS